MKAERFDIIQDAVRLKSNERGDFPVLDIRKTDV